MHNVLVQGQGRGPQHMPQVVWDASEPQASVQPQRVLNPNISAQHLPKDPWGPSSEPQDTGANPNQGPSGATARGPAGMQPTGWDVPQGARASGTQGPQLAWQGPGAQQVQHAQRGPPHGPQHAQRGSYQGQGPARPPYMPHLVGQSEGMPPQPQHRVNQGQQKAPQMEPNSQGQGAVPPAPGLQAPYQGQQPGQQARPNRQPAAGQGQGERQQGQSQRAGRRSPPQSQRGTQAQAQHPQAPTSQNETENLPGPPPRPQSQQQRPGQGPRRQVVPINPTSAASEQEQAPPTHLPGPPPPPPRSLQASGEDTAVLPGPPSLPQPGRPSSLPGQGQGSSEQAQQGASGQLREERSHDHLPRSRDSRGNRGRAGRSSRDR